eukprot:TRINITY_DN74140_c0_g1_i1.p1 TRINITY_DN74140_c0_g1~~TRINITY_DN74140_c0_g1_i1.p1  ORF type:complete len:1508 (-),score=318.44 TRINITY_DN74140_c0_g1_i1:112-4635(-)
MAPAMVSRPGTACADGAPSLPPLGMRSPLSPGGDRVSSAPAAEPQSARMLNRDLPGVERAITAPGSARGHRELGPISKSPRGMLAAVGSRPMSNGSSLGRKNLKSPTRAQLAVWQDDGPTEFSEELKAVHIWWLPVEAAMRSKRPDRLDAALKEAHGASYLRTVYAVRRSNSLDAEHRHSIEMEMAARLVKARAILGKWNSCAQELQRAHQMREIEALQGALARWPLEDNEEVRHAREDLKRWIDVASSLPPVIKQAVEKRDVQQLRKALQVMSNEGPSEVEGAVDAQKVIERYQIRARAMDAAVAEGNTAAIKAALANWDFPKDDLHAVKARESLALRDVQRDELQKAVESRDGQLLRRATRAWGFDRKDEDFIAAQQALARYNQAISDMESLMTPPTNLTALGEMISDWSWSQGDPALKVAKECFEKHELTARAALTVKDGWLLERVWSSGGGGRSLGSGAGGMRQKKLRGLRWQAAVAVVRYREAVQDMRKAIRASVEEAEVCWSENLVEEEDDELDPAMDVVNLNLETSAAKLQSLMKAWPFAENDPNLTVARAHIGAHALAKSTYFRLLKLAIAGGNVFAVRHALQLAMAVGAPPRAHQTALSMASELLAAKELCVSEDAAIQAVGAMTLGVEPEDLLLVAARARELSEKSALIRLVADGTQVGRIPTLRAASKPPRVVHGVLEVLCHVVAGINPAVRDPPRDTGWRSCQRLLQNPALLVQNLSSLPDWTASGRREPVCRARKRWAEICEEIGRPQDCTIEAVRKISVLAGQFLRYLEQLFEYLAMLEESVIGKQQGFSLDDVRTDSKRTTLLKAALIEVHESVRNASESEMSDELRRCPQWFHVMRRAWRTLGSHALLAAAWIVAGGHVNDIASCCERSQLQVLENYAAVSVANAVIISMTSQEQKEGRAPSLRLRIQAAIDKIARSSPKDLEMTGVHGKLVCEPVICMIYGRTVSELEADTEGVNLVSMMKGSNLQNTMLDVLKAIAEVLEQNSSGVPQASVIAGMEAVSSENDKSHLGWQLRPVCERLELSADLIKGSLVPQTNLSLAMRVVQEQKEAKPLADMGLAKFVEVQGPAEKDGKKGGVRRHAALKMKNTMMTLPDVMSEAEQGAAMALVFVEIVRDYYMDFAPQRAHAVAVMQASLQAEAALANTQQVLHFAACLHSTYQAPACVTVEHVRAATTTVGEQLLALARTGLALSWPHVEYVRRAMDSAGLAMLANPPAADPHQRLVWAEAIMSVQLVSLPIIEDTLRAIARSIDADEVVAIASLPEPPEVGPNTAGAGLERLLAALAWVFEADCNVDRRWAETSQLVAHTGFVDELASWSPLRDGDTARLARARDILLEVWSWVSSGCGGCFSFQILFAWLSLAVALADLIELGARLKPVHKVIEHGLEKVGRCKPEQKKAAAAKAWTSALFLLDGTAEAWWWLKLIRGSDQAVKPWTDSADGGVGAATRLVLHDPADDWQQGEDPFDGADLEARFEVDVDLDREMTLSVYSDG